MSNEKSRSMFQPDLDDILTKVDDRYTLIVEIAKRARQIVDGDDALVETDNDNPVSKAVEEINEGLLEVTHND